MEREKPDRKRSQEPQKGIWIAVKDNAALVTAIGALIGVLITGAINTYIANKDQAAQRKLEALNAERQRELEREKAQDAALQTYLNQLGQMLLNKDLRSSGEGSDLRTLARARTLAVFEQSSPEGKRIALMFLSEASLINKEHPVVSLSDVDLSGANLSEADLQDANLDNALLNGADLSLADLSDADLRGADLRGADLRGAVLSGADLGTANLQEANLSEAQLLYADLSGGADLSYADLSNANLQGANLSDTYLQDANLSGADLISADVTEEKLEKEARTLKGATMPDGSTHD